MDIVLLIDFGSTYTKIAAVDLDDENLTGRTQAVSTVDTDITVGLNRAYQELLAKTGINPSHVTRKLACSSAAGGLCMVAIGLIPRLTTKAAREVVLGAGAKLIGTFSYKLSTAELHSIDRLSPDMILLAGGTDGGNEDVILANARLLAKAGPDCPYVVAGNKVVAAEAESILVSGGRQARVTDNVMPELDQLVVEPARSAIREIFMERIVRAKGLSGAEDFVGGILMPTPMAVLNGARLLAHGTPAEKGIGDLVVVDVGGATTDVHSVCEGRPTQANVVQKGLPEPYAKRTVEGDLGIRYNASCILELAKTGKALEKMYQQHCAWLHIHELEARVDYLSCHADTVPTTESECTMDNVLAGIAVDKAMDRHAGRIEPVYSPSGMTYVQRGKDLTEVQPVIGVGGVFAFGSDPRSVLEKARYSEAEPLSLRPKAPVYYVDKDYILYAMGLLGDVAPDKALRIMKKHLKPLPHGGAQ